MGRLYLVADGAEIARRRRLVAPGILVEVWGDLYDLGHFWMGEQTKGYLDGVGLPLAPRLVLDPEAVSVYYGPRLCDVESLPSEESLKSRVLSAHAIGAAWLTVDQFGERTKYEPVSPADPIFYLRRPGGQTPHVWRLFRDKAEAIVYMGEYYGKDSEARDWAQSLPVEGFDELVARYGQKA
ncbi:MAG: hypothetical protein A3G97_14600 [Candidatus Rokubacteria bacterium RIFCSPLOWO2_12_FULL_69_21]|nr:MAG: hypothetical protein A3J45_16655 [Candidatus Rokubacteria bacterium RIFCSPHIGHO2_02_FULL_69_13]OGL25890.1 MAG: hypothetical protein A3G97_14600 [Candidatus Rokubacteria bacterium RIFCSPLOWO2_12_FULL_69_21]